MATSTTNFLLFFLGISVLLAGVGGWLVLHDKDYGYAYERTSDTFPQYADGDGTTTAYYSELSDRNRRIVDAAMDGEKFHFEELDEVPPTVVKQDGDYHVFNSYAYFDYLDPRTFLTTATGLVGFAIVALAARRDMR